MLDELANFVLPDAPLPPSKSDDVAAANLEELMDVVLPPSGLHVGNGKQAKRVWTGDAHRSEQHTRFIHEVREKHDLRRKLEAKEADTKDLEDCCCTAAPRGRRDRCVCLCF